MSEQARARGAALVPADYPAGLLPGAIQQAITYRAKVKRSGDEEAYWQADGMLAELRSRTKVGLWA